MTLHARIALLAALSIAALGVPAADADVAKCQRAITKETSKYVQARAKTLQKCEDKKLTGSLAPSTECPSEPSTAAKLAEASDKARAGIEKACCGGDQVCGNADDETLASIGWGATPACPNFESGAAGACTNPIADPGDVAECVVCVATAATNQLLDLLYDDANPGVNSFIQKCQRAIGKETVKFYNAKSKILQKCWDQRIKGVHANDCPDPGDGKAMMAIAKAESKKIAGICKACGGSDKVCGGSPDFNPQSDVGFADTCPDVTVPNDGGPHGGEACERSVATMSDLVACVDCVAEFKVDCVDDLSVLQYETYGSECSGGSPATPTPTPTATPSGDCGNGMIDADETCDATAPAGSGETCHPSTCIPAGLPPGEGDAFGCTCATGQMRTLYTNGELDNGWTGTSHDTSTVDGTDADTLLFDCNGTTDTLCRVAGPRPGRWGKRCHNNTRTHCDEDADCGIGGRCVSFLGPPLPLSSGGVPVCITTFFERPVTGTVNVSDGSTSSNSFLRSVVHVASSIAAPCAKCNCTGLGCTNQIGDAGTCDSGPAVGQACTIEGTSDFGPMSRDCPPLSSANVSGSGLDIRFVPTTTGQSTLDATLPCTNAAYADFDCPCHTCAGGSTPNAPCRSDAQCPGGGVCGGRRCLTGSSNAGALCTNDAECPPGAAGSCGRPGLATQPNACELGCQGGVNADMPCGTDAECPGGACVPLCRQLVGAQTGMGQCVLGPTDGKCSLEPYRGCQADLECNPPPLGTCTTCQTGQVCQFNLRPCHVFPMQLQGDANPFVAGSSSGTSVNTFCIPDTQSPAVNNTAGLPGEGSIITDHTLSVQFPAQPQ